MGVSLQTEWPAESLVPERTATCGVRIRNTGDVVDRIDLDVLGDAAEWTRLDPPTLSLMPGQEATSTLILAPPKSHTVPAGPTAVAVRARSTEDPDGSTVTEGEVDVAAFVKVAADLVPRNSRGRFRGRHELAVDNFGNAPTLVSVAATDPDRRQDFALDRASVVVEPGAAVFLRLTARPKKGFWTGPDKTLPFQVVVTPENGDAIDLTGSMVQHSIVPKGAGKVLALVALLVAALLALWFTMLRPTVESTAKAAAKDQTQALADSMETLAKQNAANQEQSAKNSAAVAQLAQAVSGGAGSAAGAAGAAGTGGAASSTGVAGGTGAGVLDPATGIDFRITTKVAVPGGFKSFSFTPPPKSTVWVSDVILQNPAGDKGRLRIQRGDTVLIEVDLQNFRDLDYHFVQPAQFRSDKPVLVAVDCTNDTAECTPSVYFTGRVIPDPAPAPAPAPAAPAPAPAAPTP